MKLSASVINICSDGFKMVFWRNRTLGLFSSFSACLEDHVFISDKVSISCVDDNDLAPIHKSILVQCTEKVESSGFSRDGVLEFVDEEYLSCEHQQGANNNDHLLERINSILKGRGWNIGSQSSYYSFHLDEYTVIRILNALFEESSECTLSLHFFKCFECWAGSKHTVRSICTMIHILIAGNMNYKALEQMMSLATKNHGEDRWVNLLLKVLHETHAERKVLVTAYSMLVDCFVKENMALVAFKLVFQMKQLNFFPSHGVCNSLLRALLQLDQIELAWDLFEEIQSRGMGLSASIISLFIHKYCIRGDLKSGWKLLIEMRNYGIDPDVVSYTILINSLCKMSLVREAACTLFKIIQMGLSIDSVSVSSVVHGFCKFGKLETAMAILRISSIPPNIYVYNSFISKLCTDNMVAASNIFHQMFEVGLHPDCFIYTTMIGGYCKIRNVKASLNYLGKMLKRGIKPSVTTYTMLIDGYCKSGDVDTAELFFQNIVKEGLVPDVIAYNTLMDGYGKKGHLHKAFGLLDMMKSSGISPDIVTYNIVIHTLVMRGFVTEAKGVLDELIRRGFSADVVAFTNIVYGFSQKGNFEEAFLVWFYMGENHIKPDVVMCSALLNGYCKARRMDEANVLFHRMLDVGLIPDQVLYNTLIHGFCSIGDINEACSLVDMMVKNGIRPNDVTHKALVLGFEKKWVRNPVGAATYKLQEILQEYGHSIDVDLHLTTMQPG